MSPKKLKIIVSEPKLKTKKLKIIVSEPIKSFDKYMNQIIQEYIEYIKRANTYTRTYEYKKDGMKRMRKVNIILPMNTHDQRKIEILNKIILN